jgi:hypothetical protein
MTSHERRTTLMQPPTIDDIRAARTHVYEALQPTPDRVRGEHGAAAVGASV